MRFARPASPPLCAGFGVLTPAGSGAAAILPAAAGAARRREVSVDLEALCGDSVDQLRRMDRYGALGYAAAKLAFADAGPDDPAADDRGCGVMVGSSLACWSATRRFHRETREKPPAALSPALFVRTVANAVNGDISIGRRLAGPCETFVSGWTAGAEALIAAAAAIDSNRAAAVLAGGLEAADGWWAEQTAGSLPVEGSGFVLLRRATDRDAAEAPRLNAWHRSHDVAGDWSLAAALDALHPLAVGGIVVANGVGDTLLHRWRREAGGRMLIDLPERAGEPGAAGAPIAVALARAESGASARPIGWMILSRDPGGGMAALTVTI